MTKYLALLRGINVGGNNIIKMVDLKACFEKMGFTDVKTYIQSGNVIFKSDTKDLNQLTQTIEKTLSEQFNYNSVVVVITHQQLNKVVEEIPTNFGTDKDNYRYDVLFIKAPLKATAIIADIPQHNEVDKAYSGTHAIYFTRLIEKTNRSYLSKLIQLPIYKNITVRNWNTTSKLHQLMNS
ncbi:MAG: DUF1697 domain-containing protein [Flavobacteriales bacterium]|nr:DUF1697 domain-containing protein [Flavobacteriales bacterium]MCW8912037.1 DUF1697 domain-containing protein [Flavobacteriales bacterium]MCW8936677.1 DUF1697 domain-containing protein [Flavobacteriales bacterium]MCW8939576.1 DUF1697 domain-containing protein [Flavobacteriales bacterium]MCW8968475.1 DUF1697 domain-containing protein [Flavobacteriales bacterium]